MSSEVNGRPRTRARMRAAGDDASMERLGRLLRALMAKAEAGVLLLDMNLRVRGFAPGPQETCAAQPPLPACRQEERGRLLEDVVYVRAQGVHVVREVRDEAGRRYVVHLLPYYGRGRQMKGVALSFTDVTQQRRTEEALLRCEARDRAMLQAIPDVILHISRQGRVLSVVAKNLDLLPVPFQAFQGHDLGDVFAPDVAGRYQEALAKVAGRGGLERFAYPLKTLDGRVHAFEARMVPVEGDGVLTMVRDVTEHKRAELALRESEAQYRSLTDDVLDPLGVALFLFDVHGRAVWINQAAEHYFGLQRAAVVGMERRSLLRKQVLPRCAEPEACAAHLLADQGDAVPPQDFTFRVKAGSQGQERWLAYRSQAIGTGLYAGGRIEYYYDVSARVQAEEALAQSAARVRRVLESITDAFFALDHAWCFSYVNRHAEELLRRPRETLLGVNIWEAFPEAVGSVFQEQYQRAEREQQPVRFEAYYPPLEAWFKVHAYPYEDGLSIYFSDITEWRRLEREILEVSAEEQRRFGQDLHDVLGAHLTGAAMLAQSLALDARDGKEVSEGALREVVRLVKEGAEQARAMARGLNPVRLEAQGLVAALRELARSVTSYSGLPCTCQVHGTVPELDAEVATHLYRIVQEATHNAVKHARAGQLSIFVEGGRRCLELTVRDDGVGLPEQPPPGGMGLHLMHYRARMIGAALRVEAGPEGGTQVTCTLPLQGRPARCRRATPS